VAEERAGGTGRRTWRRAWLVVGLAAWAEIGIVLVDRAGRLGLVNDISFSPYHVVGYAALLTLGAYVGWAVFRALRRGGWRRAFPSMYSGLGLGFVLLVGWVVLDIVWRNTLGINQGIEGGLAPPRLLLPAALILLAAGPLREAIADRVQPGLSPAEWRVRWAGVVAAGVIGGALTLVAFSPVRDPLNDLAVNPGVDAAEIWTMAANGSSQTRVVQANGDGVDYSLPAWSPDGARIAYTQWTNAGDLIQNARIQDQTAAIWSMAADGSDRREVLDGAPNQAWIPAWSPDGRWIAYTLSPNGPPPAAAAGPQEGIGPGQVGPPTAAAGASIWVVHPDGSGKRRVTAEGIDALSLVWSPAPSRLFGEGPKVAFLVATGGGSTDIHVATLTDGVLTGEHPIAADAANDWGPSWSPSGDTIAFTSDRSGNEEIWVASLDGSTLTRLTDDLAGDWVPAFSPDGSHIAFVSDRSGDADVWSMAADGSDPRNLTDHPMHFDGQWSVTWAPDGSRIAYAAGTYGDAAGSGWVREDLAAAEGLLFGLALAIVALLVVALGAPLGSFTLALTIVVAMSALATDDWRFLAAAIVAGAIVDGLVRSIRLRHRARVAAAALPGLANLAIGLTIGAGGTLAWSITLLLGVAMTSAALGWGLAVVAERVFAPVDHSQEVAPAIVG
jgi:Tol biopolymer transport system component